MEVSGLALNLLDLALVGRAGSSLALQQLVAVLVKVQLGDGNLGRVHTDRNAGAYSFK